MYRPYHSIALVLALLLARSEKTRIRISEKTFRLVSGRRTLRDALISNVKDLLEDSGVMMFRLERGGFALIAISAFEGAPSFTLNRTFPNWRTATDAEMATELGVVDPNDEDE
jgi:hypothetical protein